MLAALLLVAIVVDTLATVYCVVRVKGLLEYVQGMQKVVTVMGDVVRNLSKQEDAPKVSGAVDDVKGDVDGSLDIAAAVDLASQATPEQMQQAAEILKKLGLGD